MLLPDAPNIINPTVPLEIKDILEYFSEEVLLHHEILGLFDAAAMVSDSLVATKILQDLSIDLDDFISRKEAAVQKMAAVVKNTFVKLKDDDLNQCDSSARVPLITDFPNYRDTEVSYEKSSWSFGSTFEAYSLPEEQRRIVCVSSLLEPVMKENVLNDPLLKWQYVGHPSGVFRKYPGTEPLTNYDPRLRPWYIDASTGPKDMVFLLDISGSMGSSDFELARKVLVNLLRAATPRDMIGVVQVGFDVFHFSCFGNRMVPGTSENIQMLVDWVLGEFPQPSGPTQLDLGIEAAYNMLEKLNPVQRTNCQKVLTFFSDFINTRGEDYVTIIKERTEVLSSSTSNPPFIFALSPKTSVSPSFHTIGCNSLDYFGVSIVFHSESTFLDQVNYFNILSSSRTQGEAVWTSPYLDAAGLGVMSTTSLAVFADPEHGSELLGVIGIDVVLSEINDLVKGYARPFSYAFLMEQSGLVVSHPRLYDRQTSYSFDLFSVETGPIYDDVVDLQNRIYDSPPGCVTLESVYSAGSSQYPHQVTYCWVRVQHLYLIYALSSLDVDTFVFDSPSNPETFPLNVYHRLDLYPESTISWNQVKTDGILNSPDKSTFLITSVGYENQFAYIAFPEEEQDVSEIHLFINSALYPAATPSNPGILLPLKYAVLVSSLMEPSWLAAQSEYAMSRYIGLANGMFRVFPGTVLPTTYDPRERSWYQSSSYDHSSHSQVCRRLEAHRTTLRISSVC